MAFIMLRYIPSKPNWLKDFYHYTVLKFSTEFSASVEMIV